MTYLDIGSLVVLICFAVLGIRRGFICEILSIALIILGFFVVYCVHPTVSSTLDRFVRMNYELSRIVFLLLLILIIFLANLILGKSIHTLGNIESKKLAINILGGLLGMIRGVIYLGIALWLTISVVPKSELSAMVYKGKVTMPILEVIKTSYVTLNKFIIQNDIDPFREKGLSDENLDQLEEGIKKLEDNVDMLKEGLNYFGNGKS